MGAGWECRDMVSDELQRNGDEECPLCALVAEFYEQVPKTPRNYWVMTELIVHLHGSDVCDYKVSD